MVPKLRNSKKNIQNIPFKENPLSVKTPHRARAPKNFEFKSPTAKPPKPPKTLSKCLPPAQISAIFFLFATFWPMATDATRHSAANQSEPRRATNTRLLHTIPLFSTVKMKMSAEVRWPTLVLAFLLVIQVHGDTPFARFEYKYSFKPPYLSQKNGSVPFWEYGGSKYRET